MKLRVRPCMRDMVNVITKSSEYGPFYRVLLKDGVEVTKTKRGYKTVSDEFRYVFLDMQLKNNYPYYITKE